MADPIPVTNHTIQRWLQRFPGEDLEESFARSIPLSVGKLISHGVRTRRGDEYHYDPITQAVFVRSANNPVIVTVFKLKKAPAKSVRK